MLADLAVTVFMKLEPCKGLSPVAREIFDYLRRHPKAQDTIEGINEWWLLEQRIRSSVAETKAALVQLTAEQLVLARRGADGRMYYSKRPRKRLPQPLSPKPEDGPSASSLLSRETRAEADWNE